MIGEQLLIANFSIIGNYLTKVIHMEIIDFSSDRALFDETCRKFKDIDQENKFFGSNAL